jgi:DNA-binding transcriptional ArsR family regulator
MYANKQMSSTPMSNEQAPTGGSSADRRAGHDFSVLTPTVRDTAAATVGLLADATRLHLLWHLRAGERAVSDLCRAVERPSPAVSQHLAKLRLGGLVLTRREGTQIFYRLATDHVGELVADVVAHAQHIAEEL